MYNRYVRNDRGTYERISIPEIPPPTDSRSRDTVSHTAVPPRSAADDSHNRSSPLSGLLGKGGLLSGVLDKLKLSDIDTGDLLLLVLLFLLFRDGEDDELLIALGLLLIL